MELEPLILELLTSFYESDYPATLRLFESLKVLSTIFQTAAQIYEQEIIPIGSLELGHTPELSFKGH
jgi:hypothetical protein